jgi:hypothetical protein
MDLFPFLLGCFDDANGDFTAICDQQSIQFLHCDGVVSKSGDFANRY